MANQPEQEDKQMCGKLAVSYIVYGLVLPSVKIIDCPQIQKTTILEARRSKSTFGFWAAKHKSKSLLVYLEHEMGICRRLHIRLEGSFVLPVVITVPWEFTEWYTNVRKFVFCCVFSGVRKDQKACDA